MIIIVSLYILCKIIKKNGIDKEFINGNLKTNKDCISIKRSISVEMSEIDKGLVIYLALF